MSSMSDSDLEKDIQSKEELVDKAVEDVPKQEQVLIENTESTDNVAEKLEEFTHLKDSHLRLMAEYDNYRKRTIREKADLIKNGGEKVFVGLLPVIDDFERALQTIEKAEEMDIVKEGIDLIYRKFISFLQQNGIKAINSIGENFEADLFEAVATVPAENEEQKGKIIDNLQTGYTLNDKVIRHAKVVVAN